jgi:CheY-like chemotaxis protein
VDVVANGREALEALGRIDYAAVLMDCHMPEMDGFAATAEIRSREALSVKRKTQDEIGKTCDALGVRGEVSSSTPYPLPLAPHRIPIIAMMASILPESQAQCFDVGMDDYISKPVQPKVLAEVLTRWVTSASAGSRVQTEGVQRKQAEGIQAKGVEAETLG